MKYLVIARRYRPQRFCDVVGQGAILATLRNALASHKAAHAYLFSGPRGVGKTTLARLFAKALNCQNPGADFEPCNECPSCLEILSGQSLDVIEIDGASNRGIDDIRQLNETVGYAPAGKYKIYLIDEVHMLTKEAFNALLKTLEEPPPKAKFFFATTEPHKVLPTILSRCQRFDLQRLTSKEIAEKLLFIAKDLQREVAPDAAALIAEFSEGSLRDAESLFDQILCYADGKVEAKQVQEVLGLVPQELFFALDVAFSEARAAFAFELAEQIFQTGKDLGHFAEQLILHYRRLALARILGQAQDPRIEASSRLYTQQQLLHILDLLLPAYAALQKSPMQRVHLESMLLSILRSRHRIPVEVLLRRLSELEETLKLAKEEPVPRERALDIEISFTPPKPAELLHDTPPLSSFKESEAPARELKPVPFTLASAPPPKPQVETPLPQAAAPTPKPQMEMPLPQAAASTPREKPQMQAPLPQAAPQPPKQAAPTGKADPSYETLLRFAAVELEGTLKDY